MNLVEAVKHIRSQPCDATLDDLMGICFEQLFALMKRFSTTLKTHMALYWNSYLEMVDLMLCFIRASREVCWRLHLLALRNMLPWFQAYNRTNYARCGALYWSEMVVLVESHPELYKFCCSAKFIKGFFSDSN